MTPPNHPHDSKQPEPREQAQLDRIERKVDRVITLLNLSLYLETKMASDLTDLTAAVNEETTVEQSAATLLNDLSAKIDALKNDPAALAALATQIRANRDQLAAAVTANTPAAQS